MAASLLQLQASGQQCSACSSCEPPLRTEQLHVTPWCHVATAEEAPALGDVQLRHLITVCLGCPSMAKSLSYR